MRLTFFEWNFSSSFSELLATLGSAPVSCGFAWDGDNNQLRQLKQSCITAHKTTKLFCLGNRKSDNGCEAAHLLAVGRVKKIWGEDAEIPQTKHCTKPHRACQNTKQRWRLRQPWPTYFLWLKHGWKMMNMQKTPALYRCSCTQGKRGLH